ncbi:MAG: L-seryl-tRNA(Sec) selenium transferase [Terriglobia bacterium]
MLKSEIVPMGTKTQVNQQAELRALPSVDELLRAEPLRALAEEVDRALVVETARGVLGRWRAALRAGKAPRVPAAGTLAGEVVAAVGALLAPSLRAVINATGVVLHTNLGRAPLGAAAARRVSEVATQYSNLEFDLERGARGRRDIHTGKLLGRLLGAEASLLVNNNAAAVLLVLNTLAAGGEVVVSRGELIEIGGSFRIPEIMARSGAVLREVGTTNRTRAGDYARAINRTTRLLLRVHPSNFRLVGFTSRPELGELVALARRHRLLLYEDLGSGCLVDLGPQGIREEPVAAVSVAAGVDIISFSGDKLLGGPQAGVIAGKRKLVERCRQNPLFRALRVDKMTYAAMEATLAGYLRGVPKARDEAPALRMIRLTAAEIGVRAAQITERLRAEAGVQATFEVVNGRSVIGGGSTPGQSLATKLVALRPVRISPAELAARLRQHDPPVLARVERERVLVDLRTVFAEQEAELVAAVRQALEKAESRK